MRRVGFGDVAPGQQAAPGVGFREARREQPARPASVEADVTSPFLQAVISGVMATVATAAVGLMSGWQVFGFEWEWYLPLALGGVAMALAWMVLLNGHRRMLWMVETVIGRDLDDDGLEGLPPQPVFAPPARMVPVEVQRRDRGSTIEREDLPEPQPGALGMFMRGCVGGGATFTERGAAGYGYSREMWLALRDRFLVHGWVVWRVPGSERQGVEMTLAGRAVMRGLARDAAPPLSGADVDAGFAGGHARTHDARTRASPALCGTDNTSYTMQEGLDEK